MQALAQNWKPAISRSAPACFGVVSSIRQIQVQNLHRRNAEVAGRRRTLATIAGTGMGTAVDAGAGQPRAIGPTRAITIVAAKMAWC
jgi:hypothetical protein